MIDIGVEEMWTPFLEEVNNLLIEEKQARHENDHIKLAEICTRIVSIHFIQTLLKKFGYSYRFNYVSIIENMQGLESFLFNLLREEDKLRKL